MSSKTENAKEAQRLATQIENDLWREEKLGEKPRKIWQEAVARWAKEQHKKTFENDLYTLAYLDKYLKGLYLDQINSDLIEKIAVEKEATGVTKKTVNLMLEIIRTILRKAHREWEWLDKMPLIRMRKVEKGRVRFITHEQAERLAAELPPHLADMAAFSLATGLRKKNVTDLKWSVINFEKRHAYVTWDESKTKKPIPIPLNRMAMEILERIYSSELKHEEYVFTYNGKKVKQVNTKAWKKALKRAGIENFRWHDLRHTWASWHVQNGTSLHELQQLGGWTSYEMVLRYAHLSSDQLRNAAERICKF